MMFYPCFNKDIKVVQQHELGDLLTSKFLLSLTTFFVHLLPPPASRCHSSLRKTCSSPYSLVSNKRLTASMISFSSYILMQFRS